MEARRSVSSIVAAIRADIAQIPQDSENTDFLLYFESLYSMAKLDIYLCLHERSENDRKQILSRVASRLQYSFLSFNTAWTADKEINAQSLMPLLSLLKFRSALVDRTAASPFFRPDTRADKAYLTVAIHLAPYFDKHAYDLFVPQATFSDYAAHHLHSLYQRPIYMIAFLDNGVPVSVPHFLEHLDKRACGLNRESNPLQVLGLDELSELEKLKILEHSHATKNYYAAIIQYVHLKNLSDLERARTEFQYAIQHDYQPTIQDDDLMRVRLKNRLFAELQSQQALTKFFSKYFVPKLAERFFSEFMDCFTTAETVTLFLRRHVYQSHWSFFLSFFSDQKLAEMVSPDTAKHLYRGVEADDLAAAYFLAEEYIRNRAQAGETRSFVAAGMNYLGGYVGLKAAYTKDDKIKAARLFQENVLGKSTVSDLFTTLYSSISTEQINALLTGELAKTVVAPLLKQYHLDTKTFLKDSANLTASMTESISTTNLSMSRWFGWG